MSAAIGILLVLALAALMALLSDRAELRSLKRRMAAEWGARPGEEMDAEALEAVADYRRERAAAEGETCPVDDTTWNDLDMDRVFIALNRTESVLGEEALYAMLRETGLSDEALARREARIRALGENAAPRRRVRLALARIGKHRHHGASAYLFHSAAKLPQRGYIYAALALAPPLFLLLSLLQPVFLFGLMAAFAVNLVVYYRTGRIWMAEIVAVRHIASVLRAAKEIAAACPAQMREEAAALEALCREMRPVARWNGLFAMQRQGGMDFITDYLRIFFLLDMQCLTRLAAFFARHNAALRALYALVGEIDACLALAAHRASGAVWTRPRFIPEKRVEALGLAHPLLRAPVRNDICWERSILITGSNASGKSTFLKAMAVNAILAQSVMTCAATDFALPRARVLSSMALRDDLQSEESYFVVELKSLRRILTTLDSAYPTLAFIDEILRGTNTVERIAASAALLRHLQSRGCLCMAATHDQELTEMLPGYRQLHFREEMTATGMAFSYKFLEGPSDTRNAIALLEQMQFPADIVTGAKEAAGRFDAFRRWT